MARPDKSSFNKFSCPSAASTAWPQVPSQIGKSKDVQGLIESTATQYTSFCIRGFSRWFTVPTALSVLCPPLSQLADSDRDKIRYDFLRYSEPLDVEATYTERRL